MGKTQAIDVEFIGGKKLLATMGDTVMFTDQPVKDGGEGTAPTPFELFLNSLATCAGFYALKFCEGREISTDGLALRAVCEFAEKGFHVDKMTFEITLPEGFPEKYKDALVRSVNLCTVKKHITEPPEFDVVVKA